MRRIFAGRVVGGRRLAGLGVASLGVAGVALMGWGLRPVAAQDDAKRPEFYTTRVQPILQTNCYRCHGGMNHRGGLSMATKAGLVKGGRDGTVLVPGDPAKSLLVRLIRHEGPTDDPMPMPPKGKISDAEIDTVEQWVRAGAIMPDDAPKP